MQNPALWAKLKSYPFTLSHPGKSLLDALVEQTKLGRKKAQAVIEEYRKFIYLIATGQDVLAPSPLVDKVWHIHLEDDQAYRQNFCETTIGRMINHIEGRPSPFEDGAYRKTLERYADEFGTQAPKRIWPTQTTAKLLKHSKTVVIIAIFASLLAREGYGGTAFASVLIMIAAIYVVIRCMLAPWSADRGSLDAILWSDCEGGDGDGCGGCGGD